MPSSRCRRASSTRDDHSSATPRSISAARAESLPNATSPAISASDAASSDRISSSDGGEIAAPARDREPPVPSCTSKCRRRSSGTVACQPFGDGEVRRRLLERPAFDLDAGEHRRQFRIRRPRTRPETRPAARGSSPPDRRGRGWPGCRRAAAPPAATRRAACACWIASTTYPCSANQRAAARCSGRDLVGRGSSQLEPQQVGEQVVVAEPRSPHVERHDERVRLLEPLTGSAPSPSRR